MPATDAHNQAHYDAVPVTTREARANGPLILLKRCHNGIKRDLLRRYAAGATHLLDLGCGRGGDIGKWSDVGVACARGLDISVNELHEARRRAADARTLCSFVHTDDLGVRVWHDPDRRVYDVVTAMFSLHYFFSSEYAFTTLLRTVCTNLRPGGYFMGCVPDGGRVSAWVAAGRRSPWLRIDPMWTTAAEDPPAVRSPFGHAYGFALRDTVTAAPQTPPVEYLVDFDEMVGRAAAMGLRLVETRYFSPPNMPEDLREISHLFRTFVFVYTGAP